MITEDSWINYDSGCQAPCKNLVQVKERLGIAENSSSRHLPPTESDPLNVGRVPRISNNEFQ